MQIKGIKVEWTQTFEHHCILINNRLLYFTILISIYYFARCTCQCCQTELLDGATKYRCCKEITSIANYDI